MAEGKGWSTGKIVLVVVGAAVLLGLICCGASLFLSKDLIKQTVSMVERSVAFQEALRDEIGGSGHVRFASTSPGTWTLVVGVPDAVPEEELERVEEGAWRAFVKSFPEEAPPVRFVAVGRLAPGGKGVTGWESRTVPVEALVERTGVEAPPTSEVLAQEGMEVNFRYDW